MEKKDGRYFNIPVQMLRNLIINKAQFFDDAFNVGVYLCSKKWDGTEVKKYKDAKHFLGVTQGCSPETAIRDAKQVLSGFSCDYPTTGIEKEMYFDFYKNHKTEFDLACLAAFLAIKSIIGSKPYCKTNKAFIHARMFGYVTVKDMPAKLTEIQKKYQSRWYMDKVLLELQTNWFLKLISDHQRGMYISFDISLEDLAVKSMMNKQRAKIKALRENKKRAIEAARGKITAN